MPGDLGSHELAAWLEVDIEQLHRNPIATDDTILGVAMERLGIPFAEDDVPRWFRKMCVRAERLVLVLHSWIDSFADGRVYRVGPSRTGA